MDTSSLIIIVVAAAIVAVVVMLLLRRLSWGSSPGYVELTPRQPSQPAKPSPTPPVRLDPAAEQQLRQLVAQGQKIEAIKHVRELTGLGLKEAKDYVESLPAATAFSAPALTSTPPTDQSQLEREARALLDSGDTIAAVKRVRELTGWGLKESREYVQSLSPARPGVAPSPLTSAPSLGDPASDPEVQVQLARGNKIQAIKRVRELTGWGLKEAKDFVDRLERGG